MTIMENETKVFIAGSRRLSRLSREVMRRIDNVVDKGFTVVVGDANGMDKAVQRYLDKRRYENVLVFCMEGICRNNIGHWPTRNIKAAEPARRDFSYFSTKDRVMAEEADYGLMLWDGRSRGTLTSIVDFVRRGKPVLVYLAPRKSFHTLRRPDQLTQMLVRFDPAALHRIGRDLHADATRETGTADSAPLF
jgi:hypothetical protein